MNPHMKFDVGILATQPVPAIVRQVQLAEALGYETAWIADSHLVCRELYVILTACALATSRIKLGPGVTVPHTRHPSVTASGIASLTEIAEGRIVLGVGTGDSAAGTLGLDMRRVAKVSTIEAMTKTIRRLLEGKPAPLEGGFEARMAWLDRPRAVPIYVAGSGPRMLEAAGRLGDGVLVFASTTPWILEAALRQVETGAKAVGARLADRDVVLWAPMSVSHDRASARAHVRGRVASAARHPLPVTLDAEDAAAIETIRQRYDFFAHATAQSEHAALVPERFIDMFSLAGTPAEIVERVRQIAEVPGLARIAVLPQVPGGPFGDRETVLKLFADEVMARVA